MFKPTYAVPGNNMDVSVESQFCRTIKELFQNRKPTKIIETGTHLGLGSTRVICNAILNAQLKAKFYSIEVNPRFFAVARANCLSYPVLLKLGLSVPRDLLPTKEAINEKYVQEQPTEDIFVDGIESRRAEEYFAETDFAGQDNLLEECLLDFDYAPDFILLDSAGHMGYIEFAYILPKIKKSCLIALDDTNHVKHWQTMKYIKQNLHPKGKFKLIVESEEKFGFAIVEYDPFYVPITLEGRKPLATGVK